eukprot:13907122-Heterocapsa_arctica.AAC.1
MSSRRSLSTGLVKQKEDYTLVHPSTEEHWDEFNIQTGTVRGPVNDFRRTIQKLGWKDNTPTSFTDHNNQTRNLDEWHDCL